MLHQRTIRLALVAALALGGAACDDETPTAPNNPPAPVTVTFSGTVVQSGVQLHSFKTAGSGTVTATLKELTPNPDLVVGFSLGNLSGETCQQVLVRDSAKVGDVLTGTMSGIGDLCVRIYDVGNIANTPSGYTVEVVHP